MAGIAIKAELTGFAQFETGLSRLSSDQGATLLEALARLIREQTVDRLTAGGPAPDGAAWAPNIEGRTPVLHRSGALARSIDYLVQGTSAVVGSGLVYAAIHQFGGVIKPKTAPALVFRLGGRLIRTQSVTMPARPYIGISADNRAELLQATGAYLRRLFG